MKIKTETFKPSLPQKKVNQTRVQSVKLVFKVKLTIKIC